MAYMLDVLNEEYDRLISKKDFYMNLVKNLQHGSIQIKKINGRKYAYLCYREKGKVVSKYIPKEKLEKVRNEILQYKQSKTALKNINDNLKLIKKVL